MTVPDSTVGTRRCGRCGEDYPATPKFYYRTSGGKARADGLYSICKACMCYPENRAKTLAQMLAPDGYRVCAKCLEIYPATTKYFKYHSEGRLRAKCRACEVLPQRQAHERAKMQCPDGKMPCVTCLKVYPHTSDYFRVGPRGNCEAQCLRCLRKAKKERLRRAREANRAAHNEAALIKNHLRRARRRKAEGTHTLAEILQMYDDQQGLCAYCDSPLFARYHIDHMTPLSRGGCNDWTNLAITCPECNQSKHTKTAEEFMNERRLL